MKNVLFILIAFVIPHIALAQQRIYVQASATGANNGQSWANAFTDLKTALQTSHPGDTLWVAQGIYRPTLTNDRNISFEPKSGTVLYGGFAGTETQLSQRDWQKYPTVLSGDIGLPGDSLDNSRCVVYLHEPDSNTVLDGFTIRHGFADLTSIGSFERGRSGGGLYIMGAEAEAYPTIRNCRFEHNSSRTFGGGAMVNGSNDGSVGPLFQHCTFWNNQALNGGGMARQGASWIKRGVCWDSCIFLSNHAINRGGGIYYFDTDGQDSTRIDGCQFIKNTAGVAGGGTFLYIGRNNGPLHCTVSRSLFSMNEAGEGAAVDFFTNFGSFEGSIQVCWSVFDNNTSQGGGTSNSVVYTDMIAKLTSSSVLLNENLFQNHTVASSVALVGCAEGRFLGSKNSFIKNSSVCFWYGSCFKAFLSDNVYQENDSVSCCVDNGNTLPNGIISYQNCIFMKNKFTFQGRYIKVSGWKVSVEIKNCNFYGGTKLYCLVAGSSDSLPFLTYSNNSFHAIPNPIYFTEHLKTYISHSSFDTFDCSAQGPLITCGPGIVTGLDPLFVAPDSGNYRLQPCSPLVNAGSNAYVNSATDLAGQPRIQGGTVDIGAYETAPPTLSTAPTVTPACKGQPNGSVSLPAIGGCTPLTYAWASSGGQGGTGTGGLAPGLYTFTISDQRGSSTTLSLSVPDSSGIHISTLATPLLCGDTLGGSLLARALGGVPPLGFSWAGSTSTDSLRLGLAPGLYTVSVSDERGCTGSAVAEVKRQGHLASTVEVGRISCFGAADGSFTVLPLHGKAPWHWQWQGSSHDGPR